MTLLGDMVTDDVDFVNVIGLQWKVRQQVVDAHAALHRDRFKSSMWTNERVTLQFVRADVALARVKGRRIRCVRDWRADSPWCSDPNRRW
jgi:hypothetical protein